MKPSRVSEIWIWLLAVPGITALATGSKISLLVTLVIFLMAIAHILFRREPK